MKKTWCVSENHYSNTNNITQYEKRNPKTKKLVEIFKGTCTFCGRNESQTFTKCRQEENLFLKMQNVHTDIDQF